MRIVYEKKSNKSFLKPLVHKGFIGVSRRRKEVNKLNNKIREWGCC